MKLPDPPLLVITDRRQAALPLLDIVEAALAAGCCWISVREKDLPEGEQIALAESLLLLVAHRFGARLTLHGDIAAAAAFDGVHLPDGGDSFVARKRLGEEKLIGLSVHSIEQTAAADPAMVDYLLAGPVYETASKPGYGPILGCDGLADFVRATSIPVIAIGGIDAANIADVMRARAAGIAVMGGVMRARDPGRKVQALLAALKAAKP